MIEVMVGKNIPLTLQVHDGYGGLTVLAVLIDNYGKEHGRIQLNHVANGLYLDATMPMPDVEFVTAQYFTDRPEDYEIAQDIFKAIPKPIKEEIPVLGEVISVEQLDDVIVGEVTNEEEIENP